MGAEQGGPGQEAANWRPKGKGKLETALMAGAAALGLSGDMQQAPETTQAMKSTMSQEARTQVRESATKQAYKNLMDSGNRWQVSAGDSKRIQREVSEKKRIDEILREVQQLPDIDTPEAKGNVQK